MNMKYSFAFCFLLAFLCGCAAAAPTAVGVPPTPTTFLEPTAAYDPAEAIPPPTEAVYGPPSVEVVTFPANSGGEVDRESLMNTHGLSNDILRVHEDSAMSLALEGGYSAEDIAIHYIDKGS